MMWPQGWSVRWKREIKAPSQAVAELPLLDAWTRQIVERDTNRDRRR